MSKRAWKHSKNRSNMNEEQASGCPCQSGLAFRQCCQPFITLQSIPATAEQLMRSRYTAYTRKNSEYLLQNWHTDFRPADIDFTHEQHQWIGLKILSTHLGGKDDNEGQVHFIAHFKLNGKAHRLEENSRFKKIAGQWFYLQAEPKQAPLKSNNCKNI
jgi:SEC-C motif-containing protein